MAALLNIKDSIRDFLRKYDELVSPVFRFVLAYVLFWSVNVMYGYSELFTRAIVVFLLSVIAALVSDVIVVLLAGAVILVNAFSVSIEIGILFFILFIIMYCMYMRMFPDCSWVLAVVPVLLIFKLQYAIPLVVMMFAGASGIVPMAFGVILYYFAVYTKDVSAMLQTAAKEEDVETYDYIIDSIAHNREILLMIIIFAFVILVSSLIYRMSFDYSWYVAIAVGAISTIIFSLAGNVILDVDASDMGALIVGTIVGALVALFVQVCKGIVDYSRKETVQFEDDDYYYYVKAIPKLNVATKNKDVKKINDVEPRTQQERRPEARPQRPQQGQRPESRVQRPQQGQRPEPRVQRPQQSQRPEQR